MIQISNSACTALSYCQIFLVLLFGSHLISFTTHINSSFSSSLQLSSQLLLLIFHHLLETNSCVMFPAAAHTHVLVQPRLLCPLPFWLALLILVVFDYFLVILPNFHCTITSFPLTSYFFDFYVCKPLVCPGLSCDIC